METPSDTLAGFWEEATLCDRGILIGAWAQDIISGAPPSEVFLRWGRRKILLPMDLMRDDVAKHYKVPNEKIAVNTVVEAIINPHEDLSNASITAVWPDKRELILEPTEKLLSSDLFRSLKFSAYLEFEEISQNPAFRTKSSLLQAYGAARAMRISGEDEIFWVSGAVVAIYRCIIDGVFRIEEAHKILLHWKKLQIKKRQQAIGIELRWCTSMHLAAAYAYLAWGRLSEALDELCAMSDYVDRMETWPQSLTNFGIGRFLFSWLAIKLDRREAALIALKGTESMFQNGVKTLIIWNYYMYEELREALKVWQFNFVLKKYLENEPQEHVLPKNIRFRISDISATTATLVSSGLIPDWKFPEDARP